MRLDPKRCASAIAAAAAALVLFLGVPATAQDSRNDDKQKADKDKNDPPARWERSSYYGEDAWRELREWLDGDEYRPVYPYYGEGRDEDEAARAEEPSAHADFYEGYEFAYDYGFDDPWYGYADEGGEGDEENDWFYDFWDDGLAHYRDADDDGIYEYSDLHFDYDGNGYYDAYLTQYDSDADGDYDEVDYFLLDEGRRAQAAQRQGHHLSEERKALSRDSTEHKVRGEIAARKKVNMRDGEHLVVRLMDPEDLGTTSVVVDLGPMSALDREQLRKGETLEARGPLVKVGERQVLLAQQLRTGERWTKVERDEDEQVLSGRVAAVHKANLRGTMHLFAIVETGPDRRALVDLGPADRIEFDIERNDRIEVTGAPLRIGEQRVLMAHELRHERHEMRIDRGPEIEPERAERRSSRG